MKFEKQNIPFTMVANEVLTRTDVSFKAKGLFAYLFSKPDGWDFSSDRIAKESKEERKAILRVLDELEEAGLLARERQTTGRMKYILTYAEPLEGAGMAPLFESQSTKVVRRQNASVPKRLRTKVGRVSNTDSPSNTDKESKKDIATQGVAEKDPINDLIELFKEVNPAYERLYPMKPQREALKRLVAKVGIQKVINAIKYACMVSGDEFAPTITTPMQLESKLGLLIAHYKKQGKKVPILVSI